MAFNMRGTVWCILSKIPLTVGSPSFVVDDSSIKWDGVSAFDVPIFGLLLTIASGWSIPFVSLDVGYCWNPCGSFVLALIILRIIATVCPVRETLFQAYASTILFIRSMGLLYGFSFDGVSPRHCQLAFSVCFLLCRLLDFGYSRPENLLMFDWCCNNHIGNSGCSCSISLKRLLALLSVRGSTTCFVCVVSCSRTAMFLFELGGSYDPTCRFRLMLCCCLLVFARGRSVARLC